jgi:hypothetical protein
MNTSSDSDGTAEASHLVGSRVGVAEDLVPLFVVANGLHGEAPIKAGPGVPGSNEQALFERGPLVAAEPPACRQPPDPPRRARHPVGCSSEHAECSKQPTNKEIPSTICTNVRDRETKTG